MRQALDGSDEQEEEEKGRKGRNGMVDGRSFGEDLPSQAGQRVTAQGASGSELNGSLGRKRRGRREPCRVQQVAGASLLVSSTCVCTSQADGRRQTFVSGDRKDDLSAGGEMLG